MIIERKIDQNLMNNNNNYNSRCQCCSIAAATAAAFVVVFALVVAILRAFMCVRTRAIDQQKICTT